ncbi:TetR/AcrR family transcriptional regulator [Pseudofrankia inefficax]|uniref:Tetracyclin repressor domain-containing protein n=1 Tax=Pseudofrankia inefficax (strain DSM 45817 / CECT 9037 / DDB 130130 / EuI1c) TaxID=298654 RepID=E3IVQ2_PSEI1|nr:TetR/AcrR family transcriptional regulator C-terminal domain-containing protein [Pseudofrankia inefficax]ADP83704.1 Tetracyclin repressor domain-containing protein [Pseudofrankia inefficax]
MRGHADKPRTPPAPTVGPGSIAGDDTRALLDWSGRRRRRGASLVPSAEPDDEALGSLWFRPAPTDRPTALTREAIVATALELADAEGIDAVSIRRVAGVLGARPMSLYSHIGRKQDLIDLMVNEAIGECLVPGDLPADWRDALRLIALHIRDGARRHPWMLSVAAKRASLSPNALLNFEQSLAAVSGLDIDRDRKIAILTAVDTYTVGQVVREIASLPALDGTPARDAVDQPEATSSGSAGRSWLRAAEGYVRRLVETGEYPHIAAFGIDAAIQAHEFDADAAERRFTDGLTWLLDGIAATLPAAPVE